MSRDLAIERERIDAGSWRDVENEWAQALGVVEDRLVDDPRKCPFDPAKLPRCADDKGGADCLTEPQLAAIQETEPLGV